MVAIPASNGVQKRGTSSSNRAVLDQQRRNPYAPRASDFLSNISNFNIIESTLRGLSYSVF
jgi:homocitrate synthase